MRVVGTNTFSYLNQLCPFLKSPSHTIGMSLGWASSSMAYLTFSEPNPTLYLAKIIRKSQTKLQITFSFRDKG